jgi:hypothetical protein
MGTAGAADGTVKAAIGKKNSADRAARRVPLRERYNDPRAVAEPFYRTCGERAVILTNKRIT